MGPCIGDVDRDGWLDLYIPDMGYGCLLMNHKYIFEDQTTTSGVALICGQYTGWGGCLHDYDNDGYLDLFVANGDAHHEYVEGAVLARNDGNGHFVDVARRSGDYFQKKFVGRGAAWGDFDNDGDVDLLVVNLDDSPRLLRNDGGDAKPLADGRRQAARRQDGRDRRPGHGYGRRAGPDRRSVPGGRLPLAIRSASPLRLGQGHEGR